MASVDGDGTTNAANHKWLCHQVCQADVTYKHYPNHLTKLCCKAKTLPQHALPPAMLVAGQMEGYIKMPQVTPLCRSPCIAWPAEVVVTSWTKYQKIFINLCLASGFCAIHTWLVGPNSCLVLCRSCGTHAVFLSSARSSSRCAMRPLLDSEMQRSQHCLWWKSQMYTAQPVHVTAYTWKVCLACCIALQQLLQAAL